MFGTTKSVTKSGPSEPVFITKILQKIQENHGGILEQYCIFTYENMKLWKCWTVRVPNFFMFYNLKMLKSWTFRDERVEFDLLLNETLKFEKPQFGTWRHQSFIVSSKTPEKNSPSHIEQGLHGQFPRQTSMVAVFNDAQAVPCFVSPEMGNVFALHTTNQ